MTPETTIIIDDRRAMTKLEILTAARQLLRTAAYDVVMNCVTSEVLNVRFSR